MNKKKIKEKNNFIGSIIFPVQKRNRNSNKTPF